MENLMTDVLDLIRKRTSMRMPYDLQRPVPDEQLAAVLEAARWSPTAHNMQNFEIVVVDDPTTLDAIRNIKRPPSETFIRENYAQLSFSAEELALKKTGILGTMFPPEWRDPDFSLGKFTDAEIEEMQRPMLPTPMLLVVLYDPARRAPASEGDFLGIMSIGCVMENMWLAAESLGLGLHIVSSLSSDPEVKTILGIPEALDIAFSCRLGYPVGEPRESGRVRRDVADFAHRNRFGG
jgi:nitroreductase